MNKPMCLMLLGLLMAVSYAAPCTAATKADQLAFTVAPDHGGLMHFDGVHSRSELNDLMQNVIDEDMQIRVNHATYLDELKRQVCLWYQKCELQVLTTPRVELIPARRLTDDILCNNPDGCQISYGEETTISSTHSQEVGFSVQMNSAPFGMGVTFETSFGFGFSTTNQVSTIVTYGFNVRKGEIGFIGMANAQISAKIRVRGCRCPGIGFCVGQCPSPTTDETGFHESVIMENNKPRGIVTFVFQ
ncbi:hypothetical protein BGZ81_002471 [Podila clonocystis]|nr:hypothetical protein BGZ81_002471 [Podila clonocystis]